MNRIALADFSLSEHNQFAELAYPYHGQTNDVRLEGVVWFNSILWCFVREIVKFLDSGKTPTKNDVTCWVLRLLFGWSLIETLHLINNINVWPSATITTTFNIAYTEQWGYHHPNKLQTASITSLHLGGNGLSKSISPPRKEQVNCVTSLLTKYSLS